MAVDFESSQTKKNLEAAFAGESQATNKYAYYASKAKKEGYEQISAIFTETSGNEKEHHGDLGQRARARQALVQVPPRRRGARHPDQHP